MVLYVYACELLFVGGKCLDWVDLTSTWSGGAWARLMVMVDGYGWAEYAQFNRYSVYLPGM